MFLRLFKIWCFSKCASRILRGGCGRLRAGAGGCGRVRAGAGAGAGAGGCGRVRVRAGAGGCGVLLNYVRHP